MVMDPAKRRNRRNLNDAPRNQENAGDLEENPRDLGGLKGQGGQEEDFKLYLNEWYLIYFASRMTFFHSVLTLNNIWAVTIKGLF